MKTMTMAAVIVAVAAMSAPLMSTSAVAQERFSFSFNTGDVRVAYTDGYYDNNRVWHPWSRRDAREFRGRYRDRYYDGPRRKYPNRGWRDNDGDGVPNRYDDRPNNPYRD